MLIDKQQLKFKNHIDDSQQLKKEFGANTIPLTLFINQQGILIKVIKGS